MTTVINNPSGGNEGSGMGMMVGIVVLVVVILLLIFFGLPYLRGGSSNAPAQPQTQTQPEINVPDTIDLNVNGNP